MAENNMSGTTAPGISSSTLQPSPPTPGHSTSTSSFSFDQPGSATGDQAMTPTVGVSLQEITCAICNHPIKPGQGDAIFTAECSHAFHSHCRASSGNQICPLCGPKRKDAPSQSPKVGCGHPQKSQFIPVGHIQRQQKFREPSPPEPSVFNDDEPLGRETEVADSSSSVNDDVGENTHTPVEIKLKPEVSAVERSASLENFAVLINLKAPANANSQSTSQDARTPTDLVAILDISGSMMGTKLALLKRAMEFVIQNLGSTDRLSVIAFSSSARRLFPLLKMTDSGRQQALEAVKSLNANGGTDIPAGLRKGAKVMEERMEKNPVSSVMLLSDGMDNTYSRRCRSSWIETCPDYRSIIPFSLWGDDHRIPIHVFGFGADHDAELMHSISEMSGGTFSFIEDEGVIQDAFAQCIGGLLSVVVQNLRVNVHCIHPGVRLGSLKAGSYSTRLMTDTRSGLIVVGDLYADEERNFLVSVSVPACDLGNETPLIKVHCDYIDPISRQALTFEGSDVNILRPATVPEQAVALEVDRQKNVFRAAEAMAEARAEAEKGNFQCAMSILEGVRNLTLETPSALAGDQLCVALDGELKEIRARMTNTNTYMQSGRAYALSAMSSHMSQRPGARDSFTNNGALRYASQAAYQTPAMRKMVLRSRNF